MMHAVTLQCEIPEERILIVKLPDSIQPGTHEVIVIVDAAATKVMDRYPEFADRHPGVPWRSMRGMRNRIAHGYFEINPNVVRDTVQIALPDLLERLGVVRGDMDDPANAR